MIQRNDSAIDLGTNRSISYFSMNSVGKIERTEPEGGSITSPFGVNTKPNRRKVHLQRFYKFRGILRLIRAQYFTEERHLVIEVASVACGTFFIGPVSRDTVLCRTMHLPGPDLNLCRFPIRSDHRRMKRLIHIRFGMAI